MAEGRGVEGEGEGRRENGGVGEESGLTRPCQLLFLRGHTVTSAKIFAAQRREGGGESYRARDRKSSRR